jgi:hypothetical protein
MEIQTGGRKTKSRRKENQISTEGKPNPAVGNPNPISFRRSRLFNCLRLKSEALRSSASPLVACLVRLGSPRRRHGGVPQSDRARMPSSSDYRKLRITFLFSPHSRMGALRRRSLSFDGREPLSSGLPSKEQRAIVCHACESGHPARLTFVVVCREPEARDERPGSSRRFWWRKSLGAAGFPASTTWARSRAFGACAGT